MEKLYFNVAQIKSHFANDKHATLITAIILMFLMAIMLFLRIFPVHHLVFTNWSSPDGGYFVNFAKDDAVYHMRLVHNTLHHYPWRIFFDPFTYYPFGNQLHSGPLFTLIIATSALLVGLGHPSTELINIVGAYVPAIMGGLIVFPTYFIGKKLGGRGAGLIAALFLAFLPGNFLMRSMLGFTDHHVAEMLFSTLTMVFLIYALDAAVTATKNSKQLYYHTLFAALSFSAYILIWQAAIMFAVIFFIYFAVQASLKRTSLHSLKNILFVILGVYFVAFLSCLPLAIANPRMQLMYYSWAQILIILLLIVGTICIYFGSKKLNYRQKNLLLPLAILLAVVAISLFIAAFVPTLFRLIVSGVKMLFHPGQGMLTVREVLPILLGPQNKITFVNVWGNLFFTAPLSLLALIWLTYRVIKRAIANEILFFIWNVVILAAMLAQARFSYYYAINAAILTGILANIVLTPHLKFCWQNRSKRPIGYWAAIIFSLLMLISVAANPIIPSFNTKAKIDLKKLFLFSEQQFFGISYDWYHALMWLRFNTPPPEGLFIRDDLKYDGCYKTPDNPESPYPYQYDSYAIMTWWDFGHILTFIAHRIPNANPFQKGVVEEDGAAGSAPFFVARDEEKAKENLDKLGSRYVIVDNQMANDFFGAISTWANDLDNWQKPAVWQKINTKGELQNIVLPIDTEKYYETMLYRLYYLDGNTLNHFRLVYESPTGYMVNVRVFDPNTNNISMSSFKSNSYQEALNMTLQTQKPIANDSSQSLFFYGGKTPQTDIKIFEKVPGAVVVGSAPEGTRVTARLLLSTNAGRVFSYTAEAIAMHDHFILILPYPTEKMVGQNYRYDVIPLGFYLLKIGDTEKQLMISEWAVMNGALVVI